MLPSFPRALRPLALIFILHYPFFVSRAAAQPPPAVPVLTPVNEADTAYPGAMKTSRLRCTVTVEFTLDDKGRPRNPIVVLSPDTHLDKPALKAIARYKFQIPDPATPDSLGNTHAKLSDARWQYELNFAPDRITTDKIKDYIPARTLTMHSLSGRIESNIVHPLIPNPNDGTYLPHGPSSASPHFNDMTTTHRIPGRMVTYDISYTEPGPTTKGQNVTIPVTPPKDIKPVAPVYPYELLKNNITGKATVRIPCNTRWRNVYPGVVSASRAEFGLALAAALRHYAIEPARREGLASPSMLTVTLDFNPANPGLQIPPRTLQLLADETKNPQTIIPERKLDSPLKFRPGSPSLADHIKDAPKGATIIEFLIDETGRVHLPRIIETQTPEAAHMIMQIISMRTYAPPRQNSRPVVARAREQVTFR